MCELLALNANTPTDLRFSFRGLRRRGGATGDHADGWGLASFDPDGLGVHIWREDAPAAFSPVAAAVAGLDLRALTSIAHIRKATRGAVALENCHPFHRRWRQRDWVFAHNGDLKGTWPPGGHYRPEGSTDSEAAFCWLLDQLEADPPPEGDEEALFLALARLADRIAERGTFNCLIANGSWLFAYASTTLHRLTRRAPFRSATLADDDLRVDFAHEAGPADVVTILSTAPLTTDETWLPMRPGEAALFRDGEAIFGRP